MRRSIGLLVLVVAAVLAACSSSAAEPNATGNTCPTAGDGTLLYTYDPQGYCVLYPATHQPFEAGDAQTVFAVGSLQDVSNPRVSIEVTDAAGQDTEAAAGQILAVYSLPDMGTQTSIIMGGEEAIVLDQMPGQDINRRVIVVHNGRLYDMTFSPVGEDYGDLAQQTEEVYRTFIDSFTFLP